MYCFSCFFFQAEDGIRDIGVTGVQTCALPIFAKAVRTERFAEAAQRGRAHPFGAVEGDGPARQVQPGALRGGDPIDAQVRSEERRVGKECRTRWWPYR